MTEDVKIETSPDWGITEESTRESEEGRTVELSTHSEDEPLWEPLPTKKRPDPAKQARRKREKAARKKNR